MTSYVLGFYFDPTMDRVVLIEKKKPKWQEGLLNGLGGKINEGETPDAAMTREFQEECGVFVDGWQPICIMSGKDWRCNVFYFVEEDAKKFYSARTKEDEVVLTVLLSDLYDLDCVSNLKWLIPLCMDKALSENTSYQVLTAF